MIFSNGNRGLKVEFCRYSRIAGNIIFDNTTDGIRLDDNDGMQVVHNIVVDNNAVGIRAVSGTNDFISQNKVFSTGTQTTGIVASNGICRDNEVTGHTTQYSITGTLPVRGKVISERITNTTSTQLIGIAEKGAISGIQIALNNTEASMDVTFSKRNASTGAFSASICANTGVAFGTAYVATSQTVTGTNSQRNVSGGEALTLAFANITTNTFTDGVAKVHYID
jgi:parallel beta-helix repeat protein